MDEVVSVIINSNLKYRQYNMYCLLAGEYLYVTGTGLRHDYIIVIVSLFSSPFFVPLPPSLLDQMHRYHLLSSQYS